MFFKMDAYDYGGKAASGIINPSDWNSKTASSTVSVAGLGFKPKHISIFGGGVTYKIAYVYDERVSETQFSGIQGVTAVNMANMSTPGYWGQFFSINDDGFTLLGYNNAYTGAPLYWAVIG